MGQTEAGIYTRTALEAVKSFLSVGLSGTSTEMNKKRPILRFKPS
jgi:hypothetical protein